MSDAKTDKTDSTEVEPEAGGWQKILGWIFTPIYLLVFVSILLVFHPIQIAARLFGYGPHNITFNLLNLALSLNFKLVGVGLRVKFEAPLPDDCPIIFIGNHQSMFDIPFLVWPLRKHHPKFVSKIELGRGLPSISYALRNGGSILIDRANPRSALPLIEGFGRYIESTKRSAVIFPEGTRGRSGAMRRFKTSGLITLMKNAPSAMLVPIAIEGSWELLRYHFKPVPFGVQLRLTVFKPIVQDPTNRVRQIREIENIIRVQTGQSPLSAAELAEEDQNNGAKGQISV